MKKETKEYLECVLLAFFIEVLIVGGLWVLFLSGKTEVFNQNIPLAELKKILIGISVATIPTSFWLGIFVCVATYYQ